MPWPPGFVQFVLFHPELLGNALLPHRSAQPAPAVPALGQIKVSQNKMFYFELSHEDLSDVWDRDESKNHQEEQLSPRRQISVPGQHRTHKSCIGR
jgi:hypothetical protein